ncbi:dihydroorotase [Pelodictyon phaeoclathratiforme]|jgi:dihydroorotase|uniref:Dihydroorotase n=1 Tax=Pelodictyon phaeoclathratiforme (strain DSM 5477 / BU-1) TaxID=324925 RepID=B4S9S4_PELPB|nr:dihydroorotase [Pelodictyon phaeoclathratiforme]ACF43620.1 dihydroorotase, multifunctional complex type [Pelodictyon phaeoclathratiforme BU-1]MBV5289082.1 dihydroorotase [Pelodictyon phaeoclathratiforme]
MSIIFQQARIINPLEHLDLTGTVKVGDDGIIEAVLYGNESLAASPEDRVIDLQGLILAPGLFDMHCHFREPGQEYKETLESGSKAAVTGGFTGVALMPNTKPVIDNPTGVAYIRHHAATLPIDIEVIGAMTVESKGEHLAPFGKFSSYGVTAVSDDGSAIQNSQIMRLAFEYASNFDLLIIQHCEDRSLTVGAVMNEGLFSTQLGLKGIPDISEAIMLSRDLLLMHYLEQHKLHDPLRRARYHVAHISTKASLDLVRKAKLDGLQVTCEVTPHHFTLCDEDLFHAELKGNYIMKPPLSSRENREALLEALADGTIDAIATDHAPHASHEKECPSDQVAFGITGLESSLGLTITELVDKNIISLSRAIELLSVNPRKIMRLKPILFAPGEKANFTIIDPDARWSLTASSLKSKSSNTPFIDRPLKGKSRGIVHKGALLGWNEL